MAATTAPGRGADPITCLVERKQSDVRIHALDAVAPALRNVFQTWLQVSQQFQPKSQKCGDRKPQSTQRIRLARL